MRQVATSPQIYNCQNLRIEMTAPKKRWKGKGEASTLMYWHITSFASQQRPSSFRAFIRQHLNIPVWQNVNKGFSMIWAQTNTSYTLTSMYFSGRHFLNSSALQWWKVDAEPESEYKSFYWPLLKLVIYNNSLRYMKWLSTPSSPDVREKLSEWILNCITQNKIKWKHENNLR